MTDVWGITPSESVVDGADSGIEVFTLTLGSVLLSSSGYGTSSVKAGVPEIFGVTGVSEGVGTLVRTRPGDFELVKRVCFVRNSFDFGDKDG